MIKKYKLILIIIIISIIFGSCKPEPIENYKGYIISYKDNHASGMRLILKGKDKDNQYFLKTIYVLEFD